MATRIVKNSQKSDSNLMSRIQNSVKNKKNSVHLLENWYVGFFEVTGGEFGVRNEKFNIAITMDKFRI